MGAKGFESGGDRDPLQEASQLLSAIETAEENPTFTGCTLAEAAGFGRDCNHLTEDAVGLDCVTIPL